MDSWGESANSVLYYANHSPMATRECLVVLSGGMDSAVCLALAKQVYPKIAGISFSYGQQHTLELDKALSLCEHFNVPHQIVPLGNLAGFFKTALKKHSELKIPEKATEKGIVPPTYVPFRNTIMLSIAAGYAESWGYGTIFYGANIVDYSGYPDCRPEYVDALQDVIKIHTDKVELQAPIIFLTKGEIVKLGNKLNVPWEMTWSCYRGGDKACGRCPSCEYRLKGFREAGIKDPIEYE